MPTLHWLDRDRTIKQTNNPNSYLLFEMDLVRFNDGRILVVEHKGSQFAGSNDVKENELIGKVWAEKSRNLFLVAWKNDGNGNSVSQHVNKTIEAQK
jgi:hypothetical protein